MIGEGGLYVLYTITYGAPCIRCCYCLCGAPCLEENFEGALWTLKRVNVSVLILQLYQDYQRNQIKKENELKESVLNCILFYCCVFPPLKKTRKKRNTYEIQDKYTTVRQNTVEHKKYAGAMSTIEYSAVWLFD